MSHDCAFCNFLSGKKLSAKDKEFLTGKEVR